ncbi:hypothetical protein E3P99_01910 [Wallemia hederae]|uniref:NADPH-dependent diflavin oxidoreductase 1 n=1 Tax=Wallemia hederae TaxID=1540922 RepID=A0A4T0FPK1_9BASI|nr:hypothetical protein E3P99_01910 [Wallemia hederae]
MIPNQISPVQDLQRLTINDGDDGDSDAASTSSSSSSSSSIPRSLVVLYSTETGNAQDVAERLGREADRWRWDVEVISAEDFELSTLLTAPLILFVVSTTGNGEHNAMFLPLWKELLNSALPSTLLDSLTYGVFGLGDSSYTHFNYAAKSLDRRLESLGAQRLIQRGDGDERHYMGVDGVFLPWSGVLFNILDDLMPLPPGTSRLPDSYLPMPRCSMQFVATEDEESDRRDSISNSDSIDKDTCAEAVLHTNELARSSHTPLYACTLRRKIRLTDTSWWQDVEHVELDAPSELDYEAGDIAVVKPTNEASEIDDLIQVLNWQDVADKPLVFTSIRNLPRPLHAHTITKSPTTIRHLLTYHLSPFAVPRTSFFEYCAHFASNDLERDRLREFVSTDGADDLFEYSTRVRRTSAEVLKDFKSVHIPTAYLLDVFPLLRPRKFSIAGASNARAGKHQKRSIELCIALVRYKTKLVKPRIGICSAWVERLQQGDKVDVGIEKGTLSLQRSAVDKDTPLILVGPGTGIAPMRALVQERFGIREDGSEVNGHTRENDTPPPTALYFGCRCTGMDELYADELRNVQGLHYRVAHSRDDEDGNKEYVQHLIQKDGKRVYDWLVTRQGYLFISGSSGQMPKGVKKAVASVIERLENVSEDEAKEKVKHLEDIGRIVEECW